MSRRSNRGTGCGPLSSRLRNPAPCRQFAMPSECPPPIRETIARSLLLAPRRVEVALVGAALDDLSELGSREAKILVRVEEMRSEPDAHAGPEVADDLAGVELAVDGLHLR